MARTENDGVERFSETHWKSLRYFNLYRLALATLLFFSALLYPSAFPVLSPDRGLQHLAPAGLYLVSTVAAVILAYRHRQHASMQLTSSVLIDVLVMTILIHAGGGLGSGLGSMLLVTLAGAGLVGQGRLVLFYAAMATLAAVSYTHLDVYKRQIRMFSFSSKGFAHSFTQALLDARQVGA